MSQTYDEDNEFISDHEDNMYEYDEEDEGMIVDDNLNVVSQQIASCFKSP